MLLLRLKGKGTQACTMLYSVHSYSKREDSFKFWFLQPDLTQRGGERDGETERSDLHHKALAPASELYS